MAGATIWLVALGQVRQETHESPSCRAESVLKYLALQMRGRPSKLLDGGSQQGGKQALVLPTTTSAARGVVLLLLGGPGAAFRLGALVGSGVAAAGHTFSKLCFFMAEK